jgi:TonB-dependent receptor
MDPRIHKLSGVLYQDQHENNVDKAFKMDFDYEIDFGAFDQLEFGFRIAERTGERYRNRGKDNNNNNTEGDGFLAGLMFACNTETGNDTECNNNYLEDIFPGRIVTMPHTDMLDGASGDFLTDYVAIDAGWLMNMGDEMETIGGTVKARDNTWGFETKEETKAVYLMGNFGGVIPGGLFDGIEYSGNVGARYDQTDQTASANELMGDGTFVYTTEMASYNNFLPSLNFSIDLTGKLKMRFGASRALARAPMRDIAPMTTLYFFTQSGNTGNKNLVPEKVTGYDLSFEYYMDNGGLFSAAMFQKNYKDAIEEGYRTRCQKANPGEAEDFRVGDDICPESEEVSNSAETGTIYSHLEYNLQTKLNAGDTTLKGIELAFQQPLTMLPAPFDKTGVQLNYTFTDSDLLQLTKYGYPVGLQDFSENSYNAVLWYEDDKLEGRVAYNWRDDYYDTLTQANAAQFQKPYGQLDISLGYNFTKDLVARVSVKNVQNEAERYYQEIEERFLGYKLNDTMVNFSIQAVL